MRKNVLLLAILLVIGTIQVLATERTIQPVKKTSVLNVGTEDVVSQIIAELRFDAFSKGTNTIEGLSVNQSCMMEVTEFQGAYTKALKFGLFGANLLNGAPVLTYTFNVSEAGTWYVKYGTSGCLKNSWNDGCRMIVTVIDAAGDTLDIYEEGGTDKKPEEGGVVTAIDEQVRTVDFPAAGEYQVVFTLPNENSFGGSHKGGRILYYVEVSNSINDDGPSVDLVPPVYHTSVPEDGSFNLSPEIKSFDVTFNKKVYVNVGEYDPSDTTSVIAVMRGNGSEEYWVPTAYNPETFTVTFSRQLSNTAPLEGDYEFDIIQARATAISPQAEKKTINLNFGEADILTDVNILSRIDFIDLEKGVTDIDGLKVNEGCMMEVTKFQGLYSRGLKFGLYGANLPNVTPALTYTFNVSEAGTWYVKYGTSGCLKNSWNDGCKMVVTVVDPVSSEILDTYTEESTMTRPEEGGVIEKIDEHARFVNFPAAGEYQIVFTLPNDFSYGGGHKGGRVLYYVEVSNTISNGGFYSLLDDPLSVTDNRGKLLNEAESVPLGFMKKDAEGEKIGDGIRTSNESRMHYYAEGGEFLYGMYFSPRGSNDAYLNYGAVDGYELTLPAEKVKISFNLAGWESSNPLVKFYIYKKGEAKTDAIFSKSITSTKSISPGDFVSGSTYCEYIVDIPEVGNYILEWAHESPTWDGSVLGALNVTNVVSTGLEYIMAYNRAIESAKKLITKATEELCYTGSYLADFVNIIASKEHFVSTSPTDYKNIVAEIYDAIINMENRMDNVDNYYAVYQDVIETYNFYKERLVYDELVALAVLQKTISDYAEFDVTVKSNDELNAIAANFNELIQTLHNRVTAIDYFNATLENAIETLEDYAGSTYAELSQYKELYNIYNGNKDVAVYLVPDSVLDVATMALSNAIDSFVSISSAISTMTEQVRELKELSEVLDVAWGAIDAAELAKKVETEVEDNQQLASVYKLAIKAKLELMIAAGEFEAIAPLSMSSFIQNTQLYTAIEGYATPDYQGRPHNDANAVKLSDQKGADIAKFLPGWVIGDNGGNVYTFNHAVSDIASESEIAMDWGSNITMEQTLTDLPAGVYSFEIDYKADNALGLAGEIAFIQRYGDETYTDVLSMEGGVDKTVDFVYYGGSLEMKVRFVNTNTWSYYDNLDGLTFVEPLADYDYVTAAENSLDSLETKYNEMCGFYSVNYYLDGELYRTELLKQGSVIALPEAPTIEGYTFSGWEQVPNTMPAQNINIIGNYVVNHYKVEYVLDSVLFFTDSIAYSSSVPLPEAPTKEGYTFGGWAEVPESMPAQDIIVIGNYFVNYYKVEYIIDGEVYKTVSVAYGAGIPPIDMPTKEGYTFNGWKDIPDIMPAYDIIISGGFTILPKVGEYMLIEKIDGTIIEIKVDEIERFFFEQYNND